MSSLGVVNAKQRNNDSSTQKFTITCAAGTWGTPPSPNDAGVQMIDKKFNVDWQATFSPDDSWQSQKLPVLMASGQIPDVIEFDEPDANFVKWAQEGAFLPLDQYVNQYNTLKEVPQYIWDGLSVNGTKYGIPNYFSVDYGKQIIIRKDWLDKLHLTMPTNYQQLENVADAFQKAQLGGHGTYALGLATGIIWDYAAGPYWLSWGWYSKNAKGQYIPGYFTKGNEQRLQFLHYLYSHGDIRPDWASTSVSKVQQNFYAGKTGIIEEQAYDQSPSHFDALRQIAPKAQVVVVPPFKAPDGSQGLEGLSGYYQFYALNAQLKNNPAKLQRILQILNYFRQWVPPKDQNPSNAQFDWEMGHVGKGYTMVKGVANPTADGGLEPDNYIGMRMWAPSGQNADVPPSPNSIQQGFFNSAIAMNKTYKTYIDPGNRVLSTVEMQTWTDTTNWLTDQYTQMIDGKIPFSQYDSIVKTGLAKGGQAVIDDMNRLMKKQHIQGQWISVH